MIPDTVTSLPIYARPPGSGPSPKGIVNDPALSVKMAKQLTKMTQKAKSKQKKYVHRAYREPKPEKK